MHAILGFDPHMTEKFLTEERTELENRRGSRIYDVTAWNLPMAYGLDAYWARSVEAVRHEEAARRAAPPAPFDDEPAYGYLIDGSDSDIYAALVILFDRECKPRVSSKPFTIAGREHTPGAVLLRRHENPAHLPQVLESIRDGLTVDILPIETALSKEGPDLGGQRFHLLHPPRVAIASQWPVATTSFGSTWFLFDQRLGLRVSPVNVQHWRGADLRKYNVLILPHTWSPQLLAGVLGDQAVKTLDAWVKNGGTLIALGSAAAFLADEDRGLSAVRRKRDVLDELAVYDEAVGRERAARDVQVDPEIVWGTAEEEDEEEDEDDGEEASNDSEKPKPGGDLDALKRADAWVRIFSPQGALASADLNPEHWLCFGLPQRLPVLLGGSTAYMSRHPVATPVRLADVDQLRLSGLFWPEARQRMANTAYATVERVGRGQVILFAGDPFFRGYYEGSGRLLLNAVILGPGMGTSQPVPW